MHNGTVPYFKQVKRSMITRISERAYQLVQGTTDSEMMFAMFVTNFEKLAGLSCEQKNMYHQDAGDGIDDAYTYTKDKEDLTSYLVSALKATLRQVHYLVLEHEYKAGVQPRPEHEIHETDVDGASVSAPLPPTRAIGRLNLAVTDGQSTCTSRYVSSTPDTAHSLYYSMGSKYECSGTKCNVLAASSEITTPPKSPLIARPLKKKERVVVVSSEPLAVGYNCAEVPINHMVVSGPNAYFAIEPCV
jgi:predicted glutamine amidotransferase